jgi:hypothetical protein
MRRKIFIITALGLMAGLAQVGKAAPMGTAWTYQGRLMDANNPADGLYDLQFALFADPILSGSQIGPTVEANDIDIIDGYFTVELDFGDKTFNGDARWLEIGIRPWDSEERHTLLTPRQEVTPVPYSLQTRGIFVDSAGNVGIGTKSPDKKLTVAFGDFAVYPGPSEPSIITNGYNIKLGDPDGIYNQVFLEIDDLTEKFVFNNGNVGIGTANPLYDLHVHDSAGHAYVMAKSETGFAFFIADGINNSGLTMKENGTTKANVYWNTANNSLSLSESGVDGLVVKYGKVGIGMASPQGKLEVSHDGAAHDLVVNPSTGNVGIGSTTPSGILYTNSKNLEIEGTAPSIVLDDTEGIYQNDFEIVNGGDRVLFRDATAGVDVMALELSGTRNTIVRALEITGGSDLSERFEVSTEDEQVKPGMVVCIDPESPGDLVVSKIAYDRTVAGIVSGAGGVKPGMLMSQEGTEACGKHPVALTGRVYCWADASRSPIEPGDLLTTSDTPGHAMKVTDYNKSQGATLGKAMTSLKEGKGLVLVLVSLQ